MANYERYTAARPAEVIARAEEVLTSRLPVTKVQATHHEITLAGEDGKVTITAHSHGLDTHVVARTDQLRTSRLDNDVQYLLTLLPYQPNDVMPNRVVQ